MTISLEESIADGKKPAPAECDHPINTYDGKEYPLDMAYTIPTDEVQITTSDQTELLKSRDRVR